MRVADEEDVAACAMHSFWKGIEQGRFEHLKDRDNLWPLLVVIASRKAIDVINKENRRRPRSGKVHGESIFALNPDFDVRGFDQFLVQGATQQSLAELEEQLQRVLNALDDEAMREVALLKLQGFNRSEIALKVGYSLRTVARMLQLIRKTWARELSS